MIRKIIFLSLIAVTTGPSAFSQTGGDFKVPPPAEREAIQDRRPYYIGMTKETLYKIYPPSSRQSYFREGKEEWIIFDDILTTVDLKDAITFYLKNGKVAGWDKKVLPLSPSERLKIIEERHKHSVGSPSVAPNYEDKAIAYKDQTRRQRVEQDRGRVYR